MMLHRHLFNRLRMLCAAYWGNLRFLTHIPLDWVGV